MLLFFSKITVFPNGTLYVSNMRSEKRYTCEATVYAYDKESGDKTVLDSADRSAQVTIASKYIYYPVSYNTTQGVAFEVKHFRLHIFRDQIVFQS